VSASGVVTTASLLKESALSSRVAKDLVGDNRTSVRLRCQRRRTGPARIRASHCVVDQPLADFRALTSGRTLVAVDASRGARLWKLLNSSFVLWLLSSVLISGLTALYTHRQSRQAQEVQNRALQRRLDAEIGNRIYSTRLGLEVWRTNISRGSPPGTTRGAYAFVALYLNNTAPNVDYAVFGEYRTRTFTSLLIELSTLVDPAELAALRDALAGYQRIAVLSSDTAGDRPDTTEQAIATIDQLLALTEKHFQKPRWTLALYPDRQR